jgi:hypothetical protein
MKAPGSHLKVWPRDGLDRCSSLLGLVLLAGDFTHPDCKEIARGLATGG